MRLICLSVLLCVSVLQTASQYTIFQDDVKKGIVTHAWGLEASVDNTVKRNGAASWRWDVGSNSGMHILWGGADKR